MEDFWFYFLPISGMLKVSMFGTLIVMFWVIFFVNLKKNGVASDHS